MAQAPNYIPSEDFSQDELNNAGGRSAILTAALDDELAVISQAFNALNANVQLNQRDDGEIRDQRVKLHTLDPVVLKLVTSFGGTIRGAWVTATSYAVKDVVTQSGNTYVAAVAHTSGVFATDLAAVRWVLVQLGAATAASGVPFSPTATIAATNVQAAIDEADTEGRALSAALATAVRTDLATNAAGKGSDMVFGVGRVIDSIAALRLLLKTGTPRAFVTGYYAPLDGGGGLYCYDSTDTTNSDNGGTIIVAADGGRWKLAMTGRLHVRQFGAKGDFTANDQPAIQACMDYVGTVLGGGVVLADGGRWRITSKLTVPTMVLLMGAEWLPDPSNLQQTHHTAIYVDFGSGAAVDSGNHAVEMKLSSGIEGFTFFYPTQVAKTAATPTSFDWTVRTPIAGGPHDNVHVKNCTFFNSYAALNLSNGARWRVCDIQGDPLFIGFKADNCADACYMSKVHLWNFYTQSALLETWVAANGTGFQFGRIDQLFGDSLYTWDYNIGFDLGTNFWGSLTNIGTDTCNTPMRLTSTSQVQVSNFVFIATALAKPAIHIVSCNNGARFSCGKITPSSAVGAQIDGGDFVGFSNVGFQNQHASVVCTNTTTKVDLDRSCTWNIPPWGTSNVRIAGVPLPAVSTDVSALGLGTIVANPTVIGGGYRFDLSTAGTKSLVYDVTAISQRNSLHILEFDYTINGTLTTFNYQVSVDKDVGGQRQVTMAPTYPLILNGTPKKVRIPFFINGAVFKTVLNILVTPTVTGVGASVDMTNIKLYEASNASMSNDQVYSMLQNGYNQDFYGLGASLQIAGKNRIVYPVVDAGVGRGTEVPTQGAWIVGDKMNVIAPATVAGSWKLCTVAGTPGTWV